MNENVYFECRKRAAIHNERLNSRAGAAEILGISESTLAHYELGITKNIPVDVVVMMAEVYNAPELKCIYCKSECPIGKELPIATEAGTEWLCCIERVECAEYRTFCSFGRYSWGREHRVGLYS